MNPLPERIHTEQHLDDVMAEPSPELVSFVRTLEGPLVVLGAGGKMGPSLCVRAKRAARKAGLDLPVIAISRFSTEEKRSWLKTQGVETLSCDLMDRDAVASLPDARNIIYLVGLKFGTGEDPARTWAVNTLIPAFVMERYPGARIVALSTGNVYPMVPVESGGSRESDELTPVGEYANAAVGRERIFEFWSRENGTAVTLIRLNYALDLRYGVLVDIAKKVWNREPVDVTMGYANCIWQGDANDMILRSLALADCPPAVLNLTGTERLSVREVARRLGERMDRTVECVGSEAPEALLSDTTRMREALGTPATPISRIIEWTAVWIREGGATVGKPTHFEVRDGRY